MRREELTLEALKTCRNRPRNRPGNLNHRVGARGKFQQTQPKFMRRGTVINQNTGRVAHETIGTGLGAHANVLSDRQNIEHRRGCLLIQLIPQRREIIPQFIHLGDSRHQQRAVFFNARG